MSLSFALALLALDPMSTGMANGAGPRVLPEQRFDTLSPISGTVRRAGALPPVASGLDIDSLLGPKRVPPSAAPDVVGAFRFLCGPGQLLYDDPIVYPGKSGAAHLHQFFGNLDADANSTYASLRKSGESTCMNGLNRSAYWMPALLDGRGHVIRPNMVSIYYKRRPTNDPWWKGRAEPTDLPNGLRYIFEYDMNRVATGKPQDTTFQWSCIKGWSPIAAGTMEQALSKCEPGMKLAVTGHSEMCWDGVNMDTPDHRSHMSKMVGGKCPSTHRKALPVFTLSAQWTIGEEDKPALFHLSSDTMLPGFKPGDKRRGSTFHGDWFGAWEDETLKAWHRNCIDKMLNCSDGDLGNGTILRRGKYYPGSEANPRLVQIPAHTSH